jgi:hypothetical protein
VPTKTHRAVTPHQVPGSAKDYNRIRLFISIISSAASVRLLLQILLSEIGRALESLVVTLTPHPHVAPLFFPATISIARAGITLRTQLSAMPLLTLSLYALATAPNGNIISGQHDRGADAHAVQQTGNRPASISALRELAAKNLAGPEPHPLMEFLFHSHPSIGKRIRTLESA